MSSNFWTSQFFSLDVQSFLVWTRDLLEMLLAACKAHKCNEKPASRGSSDCLSYLNESIFQNHILLNELWTSFKLCHTLKRFKYQKKVPWKWLRKNQKNEFFRKFLESTTIRSLFGWDIDECNGKHADSGSRDCWFALNCNIWIVS